MAPIVVLLVEDESIILLDIEYSLIEAGFEVIAVTGGVDAIAAFDDDPARVEALLTDIRLGDGPTGWDVAHHMRDINTALPVIYMSGDSVGDWPSRAVSDSLMIAKPFEMGEVITGLATLLNVGDAP
ncbi:response regulator [Mesorhizobium sp. B1-1-5]|uniref:response regulator n=1 Tax=Mesorhizobium sp. B1-1-5 TaxID=2589979 RepID=UPI0011288740|nr:response regulator [Mesorhizobium sp. B1-1-5]TPN99865.1 response regulator [Mesorhizobium sp. B1-1-5]